jgi:hypothetical protein
MVFPATLLEPLTESIALGLIGATSLRHLTELPVWILLPIHLVAFVFIDHMSGGGKQYQVLSNREVIRTSSGEGSSCWFRWGRSQEHYEPSDVERD